MKRLSLTLATAALAALALTACGSKDDEPGTGDGTYAASAADAPVAPADQKLIDRAERDYAAYVADESALLLEQTGAFVELYKQGKDDEARALYPEARSHWERIETVAETFGDLDPKTDAREADVDFAGGEQWTGWHRIEKDLWPARAQQYESLTPEERAFYADDLLANIQELDSQIQGGLDVSIETIADGSRGLLEEVATGKVTGEEEYWSRTDLWDFQANVDGARVAFEGVRPLLEQEDPALATELDERFTALQQLLDRHRRGDGFVTYDQLSPQQVHDLAAAVDALSEPLSQLSASVA